MAYQSDDGDVFSTLKKFAKIGGALAVALVLFSATVNVPQGHVGVVFDKWNGGVQPETLKQGLHFRWPLRQTVTIYPVSLQTYSDIGIGEGTNADKPDLVTVPTKGGQHIDQQMSITYYVDPEKASFVYNKFGGQDLDSIEASFVRKQIQSAATNIIGTYDLADVLGPKKQEIQDEIQDQVSKVLSPYGFVVSKVNLGFAVLPKDIEDALQAKMTAEQAAATAQYTLQKNQTEAQAAVAKAEGEARANALVMAKLSPEFIRYQALDVQKAAINKWDGKLPTQMIPGGTLPFLNVKAATTDQQ